MGFDTSKELTKLIGVLVGIGHKMRAQRSRAASLPLSALLLGSVIALPASAEGLPVPRKHGAHHRVVVAADGLGVAAPDLPARVMISPTDLRLGDRTRDALSRMVADPDRILESYAPVGRRKGATADAPSAPIVIRDAVLTPIVTTPEADKADVVAISSLVSSAPPVAAAAPAPPVAVASVPETAPAVPYAAPAPEPAVEAKPAAAPTVAPPAGAAPPMVLNPAPPSAEGVLPETIAPPAAMALPAVAAPSAEVAAILGADDLAKVLDAYVGAEPAPVGNRVPAAEMARYKERVAVREVYAARKFAPIWIENGTFNARARSALARIDHAAEDGLDMGAPGVAAPRVADAAALAKAELAVTEAAALYGRQASGGRVDPAKIGALIAAKPDVVDAARVLSALAEAPDAGEALRAFNPPQKGYTALRAKLAELRQSANVATRTTIPYGPMLKTGMRDARVPLIRARFGLGLPSADAADAGLVYDTQVASAVADFQKAHHMPASGVLTIRTVAALSGGDPRQLSDEILANMERWRWLPRDMGRNHIAVNIPDFSVDVMHGDSVFHHARVIVGKPDKPTPLFSETMKFIIVNPYWNVPLSIVKKEMLPKLAADPNYFANHGYETVERDGQTYVRQPPGDSNALGRIKFMFPNQYSVYLHDTNSRSLFGNDKRAFSHGCVRVDAPFAFAEAVLGRVNGWTEARVKKLIGGNERTINLPQALPIHIVYFTAFVDQDGALQTRDDVYGYSEKVRIALGLGKSIQAGQVAAN